MHPEAHRPLRPGNIFARAKLINIAGLREILSDTPCATTRTPNASSARKTRVALTAVGSTRSDITSASWEAMAEQTISCDGPEASDVNACWVDSDAGDVYTMSVLPWMPGTSGVCTQMERINRGRHDRLQVSRGWSAGMQCAVGLTIDSMRRTNRATR